MIEKTKIAVNPTYCPMTIACDPGAVGGAAAEQGDDQEVVDVRHSEYGARSTQQSRTHLGFLTA